MAEHLEILQKKLFQVVFNELQFKYGVLFIAINTKKGTLCNPLNS